MVSKAGEIIVCPPCLKNFQNMAQIPTSSSDFLLVTHSLSKSYGTIEVLHNVSSQIKHGEIVGLIGENGAGKSTFLKCLCGIIKPSAGDFVFDGKRYRSLSIAKARSLGIVGVQQEFNLINELNVYENIFLGCELRNSWGLLDRQAMRSQTGRLLEELGARISPEESVKSLSVADKQLLEIAKALSQSCRLLIMDEPTTVLNDSEVENLFRIMRDIRAKGTAILYVSHKLREVKKICDRVLVLRDGHLVSDCSSLEIGEREMAERMVGRKLNQIFPEKPQAKTEAEILLSLDKVCSGSLLRDISLTLRRGEILGLAGLPGSGRSELAECIYGISKIDAGKMFFAGRERRFSHPSQAVSAGIACLSEDRQGSGILTAFSVRANCTLVSLARYCHPLIDEVQEKAAAEKYISAFQIKTPDTETLLHELSGGNQQKVAIAKGLDSNPSLFIFDEPTRGIDIKAKSEVYTFIRDLLEEGIACLLISSDLEEIIGLCKRVAVMREGQLAGILQGEQISEKQIMFLATGV
jgi:ribose transport system ATP-binding protein